MQTKKEATLNISCGYTFHMQKCVCESSLHGQEFDATGNLKCKLKTADNLKTLDYLQL
jgi:hypothetical protein